MWRLGSRRVGGPHWFAGFDSGEQFVGDVQVAFAEGGVNARSVLIGDTPASDQRFKSGPPGQSGVGQSRGELVDVDTQDFEDVVERSALRRAGQFEIVEDRRGCGVVNESGVTGESQEDLDAIAQLLHFCPGVFG